MRAPRRFSSTPVGAAPPGLSPSTPAASTHRAANARAVAASTRAPAARPRRIGYESWARRVATELDSLGAVKKASRLRACGTTLVTACGACGDSYAHVAVVADCGLRVCPLCARMASEKAQLEASRAVALVPELVARGIGAAVAKAGLAWEKASGAVKHWSSRLTESAKGTSYASKMLDAAEGRRRAARRRLSDVRGSRAWRWRLVTVSPQWTPADPAEVTAAGLRRRIVELWERWRAVWQVIGAGGAAAAMAHVELSSAGHLHIHALVYGPWRAAPEVRAAAGCIVDVRAVTDLAGGLREALKYSLKGPGVRGGWIAGEPSTVADPRLAAAWQVASHGAQLVRHFGPMRAAMAHVEGVEGVEGVEPGAAGEVCCASCGMSLAGAARRVESLSAVARAVGPQWSRAPTRDATGRVLPPRVALVRRL